MNSDLNQALPTVPKNEWKYISQLLGGARQGNVAAGNAEGFNGVTNQMEGRRETGIESSWDTEPLKTARD